MGKGGMGRVLSARDEKLGRRVAVKVVTAAHDAARVLRFEQEARTAGVARASQRARGLRSGRAGRRALPGDGAARRPHLAHGDRRAAPAAFAGADSRARNSRAALPPPMPAASCTATSSRRTSSSPTTGASKILDFGLARLAGEGAEAQSLTLTGAVFGTPGYLSPEQARGERAGAASDVFSAGRGDLRAAQRRSAPSPARRWWRRGTRRCTRSRRPCPRRCPPRFPPWCCAALEKDPAGRFPTGASWRRRSRHWRRRHGHLAAAPRSWRRSTAVMVALATLALGVALASGARLLRTAPIKRSVGNRAAEIRLPSAPQPPAAPGHPRPPGLPAWTPSRWRATSSRT